MKRIVSVLLIALLMLSLTACFGGEEDTSSSAPVSDVQEKPMEAMNVGLIQYASHPALDAIREEFMKRLDEWSFDEGMLNVDYKNANGNPAEHMPPQPNHFAVRQYKKYKLAAAKTAKSILISCGARLAPFDIAEVRNLVSDDEMELDKLGGYHDYNPKTGKYDLVVKQKTALFVIIPDTNATFNFLVGMMYSQMFNILCETADNEFGGRLPVHVRGLFDEFPNIGSIPDRGEE